MSEKMDAYIEVNGENLANLMRVGMERMERLPGAKFPPFGYFGGKYNALGGIFSYFPKPDTKEVFIDLFTGSTVVAMNYGCQNVVINDKAQMLTDCYRCIQGSKFKDLMVRYPAMKEYAPGNWRQWEYEAMLYDNFSALVTSTFRSPVIYRRLKDAGDIVSRSVAYFMGNRNNFNNIIKKDYFDCIPSVRKRYNMVICESMERFFRENNVSLWHLDFQEILDKARGWTSTENLRYFIYLDPPYLEKQGDAYEEKFRLIDVWRMAAALEDYPHHWIQSNEDTPLIRNLYSPYYIKEVFWTYTTGRNMKSRRKQTGSHELLISNRPFVKHGNAPACQTTFF